MSVPRSRILVPAVIAGVLAGAFAVSSGSTRVVGSIPERLDDSTFWRLFNDLSEPGGYFRSDNFVSNEASFQYVIPDLQRRLGTGGVYLGVGPDQNFTYVVGFRPSIAFIVDIRRQNAMHHLMYKALVELSDDRADFLSRLFARPRPPGLDTGATTAELFAAYGSLYRRAELEQRTLAEIRTHLRETRGFPISDDDLMSIEYVYQAFTEAGPGITYNYRPSGAGGPGYSGFGRGSIRGMPSYAWLMAEDDGNGVNRSYLGSEENFRVLQDFHHRNLLVPIVGDFAGDDALRSVGRWLKSHDAAVSFFYTSNVEQYLFQQRDDWERFYRNVGTLPLAQNATFIRSVSNRTAGRVQNPDSRSVQLVIPIRELLEEFNDGRVRSYYDVVGMSR